MLYFREIRCATAGINTLGLAAPCSVVFSPTILEGLESWNHGNDKEFSLGYFSFPASALN